MYLAMAADRRGGTGPDEHGAPDITALAERYQDDRVIDTRRDAPWLVAFRSTRDVPLLDVGSGWGSRARCGGLLGSGPRNVCRGWSRDVYAAYPGVDGIVWASSVWPPGDAVVLYERSEDAVPDNPRFHRPLSDPALEPRLRFVAHELGYRAV